jgi:hypothetical protein
VDLAAGRLRQGLREPSTRPADSKFTTWLYVIARNRWRDDLRARQSRPREVPEAAMFDQEPSAGNDARRTEGERRPNAGPSPDGPDPCDEKRVMTLHFGHDMRLDAITAALGLTNASGAKANRAAALDEN